MDSQPSHSPGSPASPEPPEELVKVADTLDHPDVSRVGLTTTEDGRWALMAYVRAGASVPIPEVEEATGSHPVVYEPESGTWPIARPAYPARGE